MTSPPPAPPPWPPPADGWSAPSGGWAAPPGHQGWAQPGWGPPVSSGGTPGGAWPPPTPGPPRRWTPLIAAVGVAVVLVIGLTAVIATRREGDEPRRATTTTGPAATVPTPADVERILPLRWRTELGDQVGRRIGTSGELVLATVGADELVALDPDGATVWSTRLEHPTDDVPFGVLVDDDIAVTRSVAVASDHIEVHRVEDGALLWSAPIGFAGYIDLQVVLTDELVVANGFSEVQAWDRETGQEVWSIDARGSLFGLSREGDDVFTLDQDAVGAIELVRLDAASGTERSRESLGSTQIDTRWPLVPGGPATAMTLDRGEWAREFRPLDLAEGGPSTDDAIELDLEIEGIPLVAVGDVLLVATAETYSLSAFSLRTGELRWASGHSAFEVSVVDGMILGRGLDLVEIDPSDGGATVLARDIEDPGGPPVPGPGGTVLVPDSTGIRAYG